MILTLFILTALIIVGSIAALAFSIFRPINRLWPPPAQQTWQYVFVWTLTILAFGGVIAVGTLDWNSLNWPSTVRWPLGCVLILFGNWLAWVGVTQLSLKTTSGSKGELVTHGLYRFSRNPQYLGDMTILLGWIFLSASAWTIPLCVGGLITLALAPRAEEPWLEELHGAAFRQYREQVPRFFGLRINNATD